MATATVTNTLVDGATIEVNPLNTNFTDLVTFLNASVLHADGSKALSGNLDLGSNKIVNLAAPTASGDAARKADVDTVQTDVDGLNAEILGGIVVASNASTSTTVLGAAQTYEEVLSCTLSGLSSGKTYRIIAGGSLVMIPHASSTNGDVAARLLVDGSIVARGAQSAGLDDNRWGHMGLTDQVTESGKTSYEVVLQGYAEEASHLATAYFRNVWAIAIPTT